MRARTVEMAGAMAKAGVGLLALPLVDLPAIASAQIRQGVPARLLLQLSQVEDGDQVSRLLAWADALPDHTAYGVEREDYIRLAVVGRIDGVEVEVWSHIRGKYLSDPGCLLCLPTEGQPHAVPLGVLRALVGLRAVSAHV